MVEGKSRHRRSRSLLTAALTLIAGLALSPAGLAETRADSGVDYPTSLAGYYLAASFADKSRDMTAAAKFYLEALAKDPDDASLIDRALPPLLASGMIEDAVKLARKRNAMEGTSRLSRLVLGVDALKGRQYPSARNFLAEAGSGPIADLVSNILIAWSLQGTGDTDEALKHIDTKLTGQDWYVSFTEFHAGLIAELAGRLPEAERRMQVAYEADPSVLRVVEALAEIKQRNGKADDVKALFDAVVAKVPDHPLINRDLGLIAAGKPLPGIVTNVQEGAAHLFYDIGSAIGRDGGEELAAIYLQLGLYLDADFDLATFALADLFETLKQYDAAIAAYSAVADGSPLKRSAEIQVGLNLDALDRSEEATKRIAPLVEADASDLEAVTALGNILRARKEFDKAEAIYSKGIASLASIEPHHWTLFYFRGICRERTKQWPLAEADFKKALELQPEQPLVLNYLGYSWVDQGLYLEQALDMIRKAVELRHNDGYIVDSLGWAFYRLGRYDEAVEQLEKAVTLRADDPLINDHLGDAYWQVGRRLEARFQWSHARDLKPEPEDLPRILKKIEAGLDANTRLSRRRR